MNNSLENEVTSNFISFKRQATFDFASSSGFYPKINKNNTLTNTNFRIDVNIDEEEEKSVRACVAKERKRKKRQPYAACKESASRRERKTLRGVSRVLTTPLSTKLLVADVSRADRRLGSSPYQSIVSAPSGVLQFSIRMAGTGT